MATSAATLPCLHQCPESRLYRKSSADPAPSSRVDRQPTWTGGQWSMASRASWCITAFPSGSRLGWTRCCYRPAPSKMRCRSSTACFCSVPPVGSRLLRLSLSRLTCSRSPTPAPCSQSSRALCPGASARPSMTTPCAARTLPRSTCASGEPGAWRD